MPPDPCAAERQHSDEALEDFRDADDDRKEAREALEEEMSAFDESTWGSAGAIVGIGIACGTNPIGWVACGLGLVAGGAAIYESETDRRGEIEAAQRDLARAERDFWKANSRWQKAMQAEMHCRLHAQAQNP
jgi:hypothetical protein